MQKHLTTPNTDQVKNIELKFTYLNKDIEERFPYFKILTKELRFFPEEGLIWLANDSVALLHLNTLGQIRKQLIDVLGVGKAKGILTRFGYHLGARGALAAKRLRVGNPELNAFLLGPQLHTLHGMVYSDPAKIKVNIKDGKFHADVILHHTFDSQNNLNNYGISAKPVCWIQTGYAAGYSSTFYGRAIVYKEHQCVAMGHPQCRMEGKLLEQWDEHEILEEQESLKTIVVMPPKTELRINRSSVDNKSKAQAPTGSLRNMIGASSSFMAAYYLAKRIAKTSASVLLLGETGVGKGMFTNMIHEMSERKDHAFVAINCSAIPENLVEAELFGVEAGAYTGANKSRIGKFEQADGGTLFLDEVGTLSDSAQIKLLRAIQEKEIEPIGGTSIKKVNVRIIAATNMDLQKAVSRGDFRADLLYRINVFPINIPSLKDRKEDIPLLLDYFLQVSNSSNNKNIPGFTDLATDVLYQYDYPGNIRELENLVERAVVLTEDNKFIDTEHLFVSSEQLSSTLMELDPSGGLRNKTLYSTAESSLDSLLEDDVDFSEFEIGLINAALRKTEGNISKAARMLKVKRGYLNYRLNKSPY